MAKKQTLREKILNKKRISKPEPLVFDLDGSEETVYVKCPTIAEYNEIHQAGQEWGVDAEGQATVKANLMLSKAKALEILIVDEDGDPVLNVEDIKEYLNSDAGSVLAFLAEQAYAIGVGGAAEESKKFLKKQASKTSS